MKPGGPVTGTRPCIRNPNRRMESALNTLAMSYGEWITGN